MAAVIKGTDGMTLIGRPKSYTKQNGETEAEEWRGPRAKAVTLYNESKVNPEIDSVEFRDTPGAAVASVILTRVDQNLEVNPEDNAIWEIDFMEETRDIRYHPYFTTNGSIVDDLTLVDEKLKRGEAYAAGDYTTADVAKRYYGLRAHGVDYYYFGALVLRKTMVVSARSDIEAAYTGVNLIQALSEVNPPRTLLGPLTALPIITGYANDDIPTSPTLSYTDWEWLKKTPRVRSMASGRRFEMVQEWWGADQWSSVMYTGTWDPSPEV